MTNIYKGYLLKKNQQGRAVATRLGAPYYIDKASQKSAPYYFESNTNDSLKDILDEFLSSHGTQEFVHLVDTVDSYNILVRTDNSAVAIRHGFSLNEIWDKDGELIPNLAFFGPTSAEVAKAAKSFSLNFCMPASVPDGVRYSTADNKLSETPLTSLGLPEVVEIEFASRCNLRCFMCPQSYSDKNFSKPQYFEPRAIKNLACLKKKYILLGSNNESCFNPAFDELVIGISELGANIDLTTNATLLFPRLTDRIKNLSFVNIQFSFDGMTKNTYENIRRGAIFEKTLENITYFLNAYQRHSVYSTINYILMKSTAPELESAIRFWDDHGINHLGSIGLIIGNQADEQLMSEMLHTKDQQVSTVLNNVAKDIVQNKRKITFSTSFKHEYAVGEYTMKHILDTNIKSSHAEAELPFNARVFFQRGYYPGMKIPCRSPFKFSRVLSNGDITICNSFVIGNIYQEPFEDAWFGRQASKLRQLFLTGFDYCEGCDYFKYCINSGHYDKDNSHTYFNIDLHPKLIAQKKLYNILQYKSTYYAIFHEIKIDVRTADADELKNIIHGQNLDDVINRAEDHIEKNPFSHVDFVEEYLYHNIIRCGNIFYAIHINLIFKNQYNVLPKLPFVLSGSSEAEIRQIIDSHPRTQHKDYIQYLGALAGHELHKVDNKYYAFCFCENELFGDISTILVDSNLARLKRSIL